MNRAAPLLALSSAAPRLAGAALCLLVAGHPLLACMNDRDSDLLEREGRGLPNVMQVITGRFERNPPLFYQMRLKRVAAQLKRDPSQLALYDDAAVACDRIGQSSEALRWIEAKRRRLARFDPNNKTLREHWYRYYANGGTFWAHRWIRNGADRSKISEMQTAAQMIRRAIQIKPNAHFGREKYQLKAMEWIVKPPKASSDDPLPNFLNIKVESGRESLYDYQGADEGQKELKKRGLSDAVEGLAGLVVLGNAWESLDVFYALQMPLEIEGKGSLSELAQLRCKELIAKGKGTLYPKAFTGAQLAEVVAPDEDMDIRSYSSQQMQEIYTRLRTEAEEYQAKRTAYMTARLQNGLHPDTHPNFWNEWRDAGPPPAAPFTFWEKRGHALGIIAAGLLLSMALLFSTARRKRRVAVAV